MPFFQESHSSYAFRRGYSQGIFIDSSGGMSNIFAHKLVVCEPKQNFQKGSKLNLLRGIWIQSKKREERTETREEQRTMQEQMCTVFTFLLEVGSIPIFICFSVVVFSPLCGGEGHVITEQNYYQKTLEFCILILMTV